MSEPSSGRNDLISRILGYMDRPWKAVVIIILLALIAFGYGIWQEREKVMAVFLAPPKHGAVLASTQELTDAALKMVKINQAAMAQVWKFDIRGNVVHFIVGINQDGTAWRPSDLHLPDRLPVLIPGTDDRALITILGGDPYCTDIKATMPSILFERLAKAGITRGCIIPIPGARGNVLAIFLIGWLEAPDQRMQSITIDAATELANNLVSR
jgi:hypothetical protein